MKTLMLAWTVGLGAISAIADDDETTVAKRAADLAAPILVEAGGRPIDVGGSAAPTVGDFDGDGVLDLMVGQMEQGRLRVYRNTGTNARPRLDGFEWFHAGGRIACVPAGCRTGFTPQLVDYDGDGRTDLLSGSLPGLVFLFRRNTDGTFAEAEILEDKQGEVRMSRAQPGSSPRQHNVTALLHDWDGDGDGDLLLGRYRHCLVVNEGTQQQPVYAEGVPLERGGQRIADGHVGPCVADWDGDGRLDLIMGRKGDIVWYRNTSDSGPPVLGPPQVLVPDSGASAFVKEDDDGPPRPRDYYAVCAVDVDDDGRLDLLLGDNYFRTRELPQPSDAEKAKAAEADKKRRALLGEYSELIRGGPLGETRPQRIERFRKALRKWQQWAELAPSGAQYASSRYGRHGHVWLYRRLPPHDGKP